MSTKTLRKRIALVAVSAMGFGLLTSVAANAADIAPAAGDFLVQGTAKTSGVCDVDATASYQFSVINKNVTSTVTLAKQTGAKTVEAGHALRLVIASGPGVISTSTTSGDGSSMKFAAGAALTDQTITVTGTGVIKVNYTDTTVATNVVSIKESIYIYAVNACDTGALSLTTSVVYLDDTNSTALDAAGAAAVTADDVTANTKKYNETTYIKLWLTDKYGHTVDTTNGYVSASATNGAYVGIDGAGVADNALTTTSPEDAVIYVSLPLGSVSPVTTTVTIKFNGTVVGTRTITFQGQPSKIVVSSVASAVALAGDGNSDTIKVKVLDAAGNQLAGWTPVAGSSLLDVNATAVSGFNASSATALVNATINPGIVQGPTETTIRVKLDDGTYVVSSPIKYLTTTSVIDTISVATDKTTYAPGEVVTLTITGKNAKGNQVADGTKLGAGNLKWVGAGLTKVTADPTDNDVATDGVWTYKFYASTAEGNYGYSITTDAAATTVTAQTGTFSVKVPSTGAVSNAEVLAAIVKLIASINKQIAALQKALTKKK